MKKKLTAAFTTALLAAALTACGSTAPKTPEKLQIVTTIFPEYDWVQNILGDEAENVDLTLLLNNGTDMHSFQPSAEDILKISQADLFVYVGGESDSWAEDAVKEALNKEMKVVNLMDVLQDRIKEEEIVEGMQEEHEHEEAGEVEYDEHVWLSLKNASAACDALAEALADLDAAHADTYRENAASYEAQLADLDAQYGNAIANANKDSLLFADRFPFRYLVDDYGIDYYAAFSGCSAETEASFDTITSLADILNEKNLDCVLTIEKSDDSLAKTIIESAHRSDCRIMELNSMQSITKDEVQQGTSYLSVMQENLAVLKTALDG